MKQHSTFPAITNSLLKLFLYFLTIYLLPSGINAQSITVSGYVKDSSSLETLIGATIKADSSGLGAITNIYGYYALKLPLSNKAINLTISYVGYKPKQISVVPIENISLNVTLVEKAETLQAVTIIANSGQAKVEEAQMGVQQIKAKDIKDIPVVFGEADVLKVAQLIPGIQSGAEGTSGIYVRGGGYDQNLILLDEATVYTPEHLFGFLSTFNADILKKVSIYKGDFPAQYGGRLSSVLDVQMREGNMKKFGLSGGIGLIASKLTLEGPIVKNKSSFVLSARRTYVDAFAPLIQRFASPDQPLPDYYFYDINAKANYILSNKDRIYLSGYFGRDQLDFNFNSSRGVERSYQIFWSNIAGTARWNHIYSPSLFSNTSFIVSRFIYRDRYTFDNFLDFNSSARTYTYNIKQDFDWFVDDKQYIKFGANYTHHIIRPVDFSSTINNDSLPETNTNSSVQQYTGEEMAAYVSHEWKINKVLTMKSGFRVSAFLSSEPHIYFVPEPRFSANYQFNKNWSVKASYARMAQYLHQVRFSAISFLDPWFPSNENVRPQISDQVSAGLQANLFNNQISFTNEYYYKWLHNQLEYANGAAFLFLDEDYHTRLATGRGWGYGAEWQLEKTKGRLTGWLAYTLSWSWRQFDELNNGQKFPFNFDRRHVVNIVLQYKLPKNWRIGTNWTYRTGEAFDLPAGRFFLYNINYVTPEFVPVYQDINSFRMPAYHRWDIGATKTFKQPNKHFSHELSFNIYNAYNRLNAFTIYFDETEASPNSNDFRYIARQATLFPVIPSVAWNFKIE